MQDETRFQSAIWSSLGGLADLDTLAGQMASSTRQATVEVAYPQIDEESERNPTFPGYCGLSAGRAAAYKKVSTVRQVCIVHRLGCHLEAIVV